MPVHRDEDLAPALAILLAGMLVPALLAAVGRDLLLLYLDARQFVHVFAVAYGITAWAFIVWLDLDRTTFILVSVVAPWPLLLASLYTVLLLNQEDTLLTGPVADVFTYLAGRSFASLFGYGADFMLAGIGAVALSKRVDDLAERHERAPEPRVVLAVFWLAVVLGSLLVAGANHVGASSTAISAVEPGVDDRQPTLDVTVEGRPAELRVTAVAPDGTSATKRLSRADMRGGTGTAHFPVRLGDGSPPGYLPERSGTYQVRVTSLAGVTVDTASLVADSPAVSITDTVAASGPLTWDDPPREVYERGQDDTKVGIVVENGGTFHRVVDVTLDLPGGGHRLRDVILAHGGRTGVVFSLPEDIVEGVRAERGGAVTVTVDPVDGSDEPVSTVEIELPRE